MTQPQKTPITPLDVLRAIFLPDERPPEAPQPEAPPPAPIEAEPITIDERPVTVAYPPDYLPAAAAPAAPDLVLRLGLGTVITLIVAVVAGLLLRGDDTTLLGGVLMFGAAAGWLWLLRTYYADLLVRGPRIEGSPARPVTPEVDRLDLITRGLLGMTALILMIVTFIATAGNTFTALGVAAWLLSIASTMLTLSERPLADLLSDAIAWGRGLPQRVGSFRLARPEIVVIVALLVIVAGGAFLRFWQLSAVPPEMTSDHVEKLLDTHRLTDGARDVFMRGNGGREALHFYFLALLAPFTGITFETLKIGSGVEAVLLIPLMVVLGRELIDRETGLYAAALLAVSWWHILLGRLALRIVLTPLVFTLVLVTVIRGVRSGDRKPWIWAGFWLGVGVYSYQAMRLAPLVAIAAALMAIAPAVVRFLRAPAQHPNKPQLQALATNVSLRQGLNLLSAGLVAFSIFVPMARVWLDYPNDLWNRVRNRTTSSEVAIGGQPAAIFTDNYIDALGMFNIQGDISWFNALPEEPALNVAAGALFIFGAVAWGARIVRLRRPEDMLMPAALLIMLLPSALAVAFPIENPSLTRASGVIPVVFVLAAWPLALIRQKWSEKLGAQPGTALAGALIAVIVVGSGVLNAQTIFVRYAETYAASSPNPGEIADAIRAETSPDIDPANVWIVSWPFWQDHRALGLEFGEVFFTNVVPDSEALPALFAEQPDPLNRRPLIFIVHPQDDTGRDTLTEAFPSAEVVEKRSRTPGKDFTLVIVRNFEE